MTDITLEVISSQESSFQPNCNPDYIDIHHWEEWKRSGVDDEIIKLNVQSVHDSYEVDKILNRNNKKRWKHSEELVPAWRVAGINPLTDEFTLEGVQVKPDISPMKDGKPQKYLSPSEYGLSPLFLNTGIPEYWKRIIEDKTIPVIIIEGPKKAGCLLSNGYVVISIPGVALVEKMVDYISGFCYSVALAELFTSALTMILQH